MPADLFVPGPGGGLSQDWVYDRVDAYTYIPLYRNTGGGGSSGPSPAATSTSTGVNPTETSYSLYGNPVPLSVFGVGRIGGEIISGPWFDNGTASFIISFGVPADPGGTRILREIAFDSQVVWTGSLTGSGTPDSSGFSSEPFTVRFYDGTLTQAADALETAHFGSEAVAYRPQMLLAFENLPLAATKFGRIPYVSAVIADTSGDDVNLGEAFERIAYSPWVGFTSAQFETSGITDGLPSGGLIFADNTDFLQAIQLFQRFYSSWDILQTDKLRIVDRGAVIAPDLVLDGTSLTGSIQVNRRGADTVAKDLVLSTIDNEADYTINTFTATIPRDPVVVTTSVATESVYLPAITDASTRASLATLAKYQDILAQTVVGGTATAAGLQIEPGDRVAITGISDFASDIFRITETTHGLNYTVEFTAVPFMKCSIEWLNAHANFDPSTAVNATVSNHNLTVTGISPGNGGAFVFTSQAKSSGKYYFEIKWVTLGGFFFGGQIGVALTTATISDVGTSHNAAVLFQGPNFTEGQIWASGSSSGYNLGHISAGDVIGIAVDLDNGKIWFKNVTQGGFWNGDGSASPATNTNGVAVPSGSVIPAVAFGLNGDVYTADFGTTTFAGVVPSGFTAGWPA